MTRYRLWIWFVTLILGVSACTVDPAERNTAGNQLYAQQAYDQALIAYQAAQVVAPDAPESYFNAANALVRSGRADEALATLNQALKTADVEFAADVYYNIGNIYFGMQLYDQAVGAYQQSLLRNSDDQDARYNLELTMSKIISLSPTPPAQPQQPDSQTTPTRDPLSDSGQTPTPIPQDISAATESSSAETHDDNLPDTGGTMTVDEAARLLDSIQQDQETLRNPLQAQATGQPEPAKDW